MVTVLTKTVGKTSRDYSTIALAEADIQTIGTSADLVANDEAIVFELYIDGEGTFSTFDETVSIAASAMTVDATRNVTFKAADADKHDGTSQSGVRVRPTGAGQTFTVSLEHTHLEGLQISAGSGTSDECVRLLGGADGVVIDSCYFEPNNDTSSGSDSDGIFAGAVSCGTSSDPVQVVNCVFVGFNANGVHARPHATVKVQHWRIINCSFAFCKRAIGHRAGDVSTTVDIEVINCVSGSCTTADYGQTGTASGTLTTTGTDNFGEFNTASTEFPDNTVLTMTDNVAPGAGDWTIVAEHADGDFVDSSLVLIDDIDNDAMLLGIGPSADSDVPVYDMLGNERWGANTDPGAFQVAVKEITSSGSPSAGGSSHAATGELVFSASGAMPVFGPARHSFAGSAELIFSGSIAVTAGPSSFNGAALRFVALKGAPWVAAPAEFSGSALVGFDVDIAAPAGPLVLGQPAPSVVLGVNISAPAGSLVLDATDPVVALGANVLAPSGPLILESTDPAVALGVNISAPPGPLILSAPAPSVALGVLILPGVGSLVLGAPPPSVSGGIGDVEILVLPGPLVLRVLGVTVLSGNQYFFNRERIQNKLVELARDGMFLPASIDKNSGLMKILSLDHDRVVPSFVAADEITSLAGTPKRYRQHERVERTGWTFELLLGFAQLVSVEVFERALAANVPVLARDETKDLQQVRLNWQDTRYEHPALQQSSSGTRATLTFEAVLSPV